MDLKKIKSPALLLDEVKCRRNIKAMSDRLSGSDAVFRPHFKTHQSLEIGEWFKDEGLGRITVSSIAMAKYFSAAWDDINIAFPINLREINAINDLNSKLKLSTFIGDPDSLNILEDALSQTLEVVVKVDTGYHRAGIESEDLGAMNRMMAFLHHSKKLRFKGFATHAGNTYGAKDKVRIIEIFNTTRNILLTLKERYAKEFPLAGVSIGDTPGISLATDFEGIDEVRPGNFVFYDLMQVMLGSCNPEDVAVALACPVVGMNRARKEILVHGGAIHLSKDFIVNGQGEKVYGMVVHLDENGWQFPEGNNIVSSISQEHGIISADEAFFRQYKSGDLLGIIPVHSCLTANLMKRYYGLNGKMISMMPA